MFFDKTCNKKTNQTISSLSNTTEIVIGNNHPKTKFLYFGSEKINLSSEVFLFSSLILFESLKKTNFTGVGLGNYYIAHKNYKNNFEGLFDYLEASELNARDGSSNLIKIFTEFGLFIIFPMLVFCFFVWKSRESSQTTIFLISAIITQLIRGGGYFNAGFALFALMICYSVFISQKFNND